MIEGSLKSFWVERLQVDSDERTGKLFIVTRKENIETLKFILETFDAPVKMKTTSKLFKLQHAESKEIQAILDEVIKNQQRIKQQVQGRNTTRDQLQPLQMLPKHLLLIPHLQQPVTVEERECMNLVIL